MTTSAPRDPVVPTGAEGPGRARDHVVPVIASCRPVQRRPVVRWSRSKRRYPEGGVSGSERQPGGGARRPAGVRPRANGDDDDAGRLRQQPALRVPALVDGDTTVIESDHIARYLVRRHDPVSVVDIMNMSLGGPVLNQ